MKKEKIDELDEHSEQVREVLGTPPNYLIRTGTAIFLVVILAITCLAYFIRYPDTQTAQVTITSNNPPANIIAKASGKISRLFVRNNQYVEKQSVVALIDNTAVYEDILMLDTVLKKLSLILNGNRIDSLRINEKNLQLGEVTPQYLIFVKAINEYELFLKANPYVQEIEILSKDVAEHGVLINKYLNQQKILNEEFLLIQSDFNRSKLLFDKKVLSVKDFEDKQRELLSFRRNLENSHITISNTKISIHVLEKSILQLKLLDSERRIKLRQDVEESIDNLKNSISSWKKMYLIVSPVEGNISFFNIWNVNQNITIGNEVFTVIPPDRNRIIGRAILPIQNSGKIKVGQIVNIHLNNYPYEEYGILQGTVKSISLIPKNNSYSIEVEIPNSLLTTYRKKLPFKEEMQGVAFIVTEDLNLLDRLFYQVRNIFNNI